MGEFGIQILGDGDTDVAADGLGADGEQAVETLMETLGTLGYRSLRAAILAPGAAHPDIVEPARAPLAPVQQLPIDQAKIADGSEQPGPWKCPECGLTYANPGTCVGGEFPHPPATLLTADEVHALADPDGSKAAAEAKTAPPPAPSGNTLPSAEPIEWGKSGRPDRRVGAIDRRVEQIPKPKGAKDRRTSGVIDRRNTAASAEKVEPAEPSWPTS